MSLLSYFLEIKDFVTLNSHLTGVFSFFIPLDSLTHQFSLKLLAINFIMIKFLLIFALSIVSCRAQAQAIVKFNFCFSSSDCKSISASNVADFSTLSSKYYDSTKKNEIYIHGWNEGPSDVGPSTVINAYLTRKSEFNVIVVDWSSVAKNPNLFEVVTKVNRVADAARETLTQLQQRGFSIGNTHMVGFSFGLLIAGRIGRWFKTQKAMPFPRITGLEPPNFFNTIELVYFFSNIERLSKNDATFVDVIHTNVDGFGGKITRGHVDFWPNGGSVQNGCNYVSLTEFKDQCEVFLAFKAF